MGVTVVVVLVLVVAVVLAEPTIVFLPRNDCRRAVAVGVGVLAVAAEEDLSLICDDRSTVDVVIDAAVEVVLDVILPVGLVATS